MIRKIGYMLLFTGFAAIVFMCLTATCKTYALSIWHRNHLAHKQITADDASNAIRDVTLKANGLVRQTMWPAIGMLIGGLMIGTRQKKESQHASAP